MPIFQITYKDIAVIFAACSKKSHDLRYFCHQHVTLEKQCGPAAKPQILETQQTCVALAYQGLV